MLVVERFAQDITGGIVTPRGMWRWERPRAPRLTCPVEGCGSRVLLAEHTIAANGTVFPPVACTSMLCNWIARVQLVGAEVEFLEQVIANHEARQGALLKQAHPTLRDRLVSVLDDMDGDVLVIEVARSDIAQAKAKAEGHSNANPGESPHNYVPSLAADLVLHPGRVPVRPHPQDPRYPDLWDDVTPEALEVWRRLDDAAQRHGLERVEITDRKTRRRVRDRPHVQLPDWRGFVQRGEVRRAQA